MDSDVVRKDATVSDTIARIQAILDALGLHRERAIAAAPRVVDGVAAVGPTVEHTGVVPQGGGALVAPGPRHVVGLCAWAERIFQAPPLDVARDAPSEGAGRRSSRPATSKRTPAFRTSFRATERYPEGPTRRRCARLSPNSLPAWTSCLIHRSKGR